MSTEALDSVTADASGDLAEEVALDFAGARLTRREALKRLAPVEHHGGGRVGDHIRTIPPRFVTDG
jgi:hypothetical protein